jgi:carbonic anhydrase
MTTNNQSINISQQNVQGKCDLKCAYNFKYSESNSTAKNNGIMINLTYDNGSNPPVSYNTQNYTVSNISIVSPSVHTFNNTTANAEIIIEHVPSKGGQNFYVGIPIVLSSESSSASNILTDIIQSVANNAPADGESTNLSISDFTLQKIVPQKPYFSYTDLNNSDWIVFGLQDAIPLSSSILKTLGNIIKPYAMSTTGNSLFYNSTGPNTTSIGDGIYISCQPTGSSEEEVDVVYEKNQVNYDLSTLFNNPTFLLIFQIILGIIIFIVVMFGLNYAYTYFTSDTIKIPIFR